MDRSTALLAQVAAFAALGSEDRTDDYLAALCRQAGVLLTRDAIGRYRRGEREAPAGVLAAILAHLDADDATHVLGLMREAALRARQGRVRPAPMPAVAGAIHPLAHLVSQLAEAMQDAQVTTEEIQALDLDAARRAIETLQDQQAAAKGVATLRRA